MTEPTPMSPSTPNTPKEIAEQILEASWSKGMVGNYLSESELHTRITAALESAQQRETKLHTAILNAHGILPANWVYTDSETTLNLLTAEITTTRSERDAAKEAHRLVRGAWEDEVKRSESFSKENQSLRRARQDLKAERDQLREQLAEEQKTPRDAISAWKLVHKTAENEQRALAQRAKLIEALAFLDSDEVVQLYKDDEGAWTLDLMKGPIIHGETALEAIEAACAWLAEIDKTKQQVP